MILDTNALSAWAEGLPTVEAPMRAALRLVVPSIVLGEYLFGIRQSRYRGRYENWLRRNLPSVERAAVTEETAAIYADFRAELNGSVLQFRPTTSGLPLWPGKFPCRY